MKFILNRRLFLIFFIFLSQKAFSQIPDSVKVYIDSAIHIMQTKSLFANKVNWNQTRDSAYLKAAKAQNYKQAFPAIAYAFQQLKDYHGMVANDDTSLRLPSPVNFEAVLSKGIKKAFLKGPKIASGYFADDIAYLRIPSMNVFSQADIDKRANMLRDTLCQLLRKNPKRLIIDLRMNAGGNSAAMLAGISPLFKDNILGYGVDRDGNFLSPTKMEDGVVVDESGTKSVQIENKCFEKVNLPIAVLIGPSTVSSGEILAVYLKQQKNVRVFGEPTPGFCNATEGFLFTHNQGYLLLSVNKIADAKKHIYNEMLVRPDVYVKSEDNYEDLLSDPTVIAATSWLKKK